MVKTGIILVDEKSGVWVVEGVMEWRLDGKNARVFEMKVKVLCFGL